MRPRPTLRLRLTALYTGLFLLAAGLLLGVSYALLHRHFERTLPPPVAADVLAEVRGQYALALIGVTALALMLGWLVAGRALRPLRAIAAAAGSVSGDSLDRRIDPRGPDDEIRELAETFDDMLRRLEEAFASQRRFVANASHELRTPLTVMRTELEVALADPAAGAADLRRTAEVAREEVLRCQDLIDSLLALARSEAGVIDRDERIDLADLARSVAVRLHDPAGARGVRLILDAQSAVVAGERRLLEQLLWNLAENAVRYNRPGGFAEIEVGRQGGQALVRVDNSGTPVPEEAAASLLEPFQRLGPRAAAGPGAGVGLSIARAVVHAHGGVIRLDPRDGGGLSVEVRLPAAPATRTDSDPPDRAHAHVGLPTGSPDRRASAGPPRPGAKAGAARR
jgi:signal transduction histidine kinase